MKFYLFLHNFTTLKFFLLISSHRKLFSVLFQETIYNMHVKRAVKYLKLFWYEVYVH